uniref:cytochrome c oxidase subunit III n=1 Tax=Phthiridium szechuanum TaxID=2982585 RepID=UPI00223808A6|nr:cytochrome c oxidase subunit III [Phthiridium szechuanum]UYP50980.1 cytochrome c oxidase subunit 3 [Phthiridium szechuanum]
MTNQNHPFHLVNPSPWPILTSFSIMFIMMSMIYLWKFKNISILLYISLMMILWSLFQWWRDMIRESTYQGHHTKKVMLNLKIGMIMLILSEIMFFMSFFWSFFHNSLAPSIELGMNWPPKGINPFNPFHIPLLNTIILLTSGISITWTHNSILLNNYSQTSQSFFFTIIFGMYFISLQLYEYFMAPFSISDSVFSSIFYMATGFHGFHVMIGTLFLLICLIRHMKYHFSNYHHIGFELAAWYWHFVDVIWLFLFLSMYWWGN